MKTEALLKELRVGNYIETVDGIEQMGFSDLEYYFERYYNDFQIKPILLTEEWLINFGFIKKDEGYGILTSMKQAVLISFGNHNCVINGLSFNNPTKYVHQLQNLFFALIGEELELK